MTTLQMEIALMRYFDFTKNLIVPTVTSACKLRFEADLLVLSKVGYATAVEIKVSKGDLKNDLKKRHIKNMYEPMKYTKGTGYEWYYQPLKFFYYAVPEFLKEDALEQIPSFCGLIVIDDDNGMKYPVVKVERPPQLLFNTKWTDKEIHNVARLGAMRIFNLKANIMKARQ